MIQSLFSDRASIGKSRDPKIPGSRCFFRDEIPGWRVRDPEKLNPLKIPLNLFILKKFSDFYYTKLEFSDFFAKMK